MNQFAYPRIDPNAYLGQVDFSPLLRVISGYRDAVDNAENYRTRQRVGAALAANDFGAARQAGAEGGMDPGSLLALGQRQMEDERRRQQDDTWQRVKGNASMFSGFGPMGSVVQQLPADQGLPALMDLYKSQPQTDLTRAQTAYYRSRAQPAAQMPPQNPDAEFIKRAAAAGVRPAYEDEDGGATPSQGNGVPSAATASNGQAGGQPADQPTSPAAGRESTTRGGASWRDVFRNGGSVDEGASPDVSVSGQFIPDQAAGPDVSLPNPDQSTRGRRRGLTQLERYAQENPGRFDPSMLTDEERAMGITPERKLRDSIIRYLSQGQPPSRGFSYGLKNGANGPELIQVPLGEKNARGEMSSEMLNYQMGRLEQSFRVLVGTAKPDGSLNYDGRAAGMTGGINKALSQATNGYINPEINQSYRAAMHASLNLAYALSGMNVNKSEMENILDMYNPRPADSTEIAAFKISAARDLYRMLYAKKVGGASDAERAKLFISALDRTAAALQQKQDRISGTSRQTFGSNGAPPSAPQVAPDRQRDRLNAKYGLE